MTTFALTLHPRACETELTPVLLVHGICHDERCWAPHYVPFFNDQGRDVYVLSLRGHTAATVNELQQFGLDDFTDDVLHALQSIDRRTILIGHSMGGALVQKAMFVAEQYIAGVVLLASMVPGSMTLLERVGLLRKPRAVLAFKRLLSGKSVRTDQVNRLPFFDGRLSAGLAHLYGGWLQQESSKAISELGNFNTATGKQPFPLLVIGSARDYLFAAPALQRTATHYHTEAIILEQGCHDLMLDPDWRTGATRIAQWMAHEQL